MGKGQSPTTDELKFIYDLLAQGYSDADIIKEYEELRRQGKLGALQFRQDIRFIRQRRIEFETARIVLEGDIKKIVDPVVPKRREEHYEQLSEIASVLLSNGLDTLTKNDSSVSAFPYTLWSGESGTGILQELLSTYLLQNIEQLNLDSSDFDLRNFICHLEAEYPEIRSKGFFNVVINNPYEIIEALRILSQKRLFKGICPVCKDWQ